jgi:hypothetical protein
MKNQNYSYNRRFKRKLFLNKLKYYKWKMKKFYEKMAYKYGIYGFWAMFIILLIILLSSCKTISQCSAYGEVHHFQGKYKAKNNQYKFACPAYGEHKNYQKLHQREIESCRGFK